MGSLVWYEVGNNLSLRIIQAARAVFHCLGPGYPQREYRRAVMNMLERQNLEVQELFPVDVWQSNELVDLYFLDLFVEWRVIVKIQTAVQPLWEGERKDMAENMRAAAVPMGVILNFGRGRLEYEKLVAQ